MNELVGALRHLQYHLGAAQDAVPLTVDLVAGENLDPAGRAAESAQRDFDVLPLVAGELVRDDGDILLRFYVKQLETREQSIELTVGGREQAGVCMRAVS